MTEKIIIAGAGGQGVMLLGKILADAAMREDKFVTWIPAYGAEVRGGTSFCMIVISDEEISSPVVIKIDSLIAMNQPSWDKFKTRLNSNGLLILNSSLAKPDAQQKNSIVQPFTDIAIELGNIRVANMVALGSYIGGKGIITAQTVIASMEDIAPKDKKDLLEINKKALFAGINLVKK